MSHGEIHVIIRKLNAGTLNMTPTEFRPSYTYFSYESFEGGRGYIGYRKCPAGVMPWEDTSYLGHYTDKTFKPDKKIIIRIFLSQQEAKDFETFLQEKHNVTKNSYFANKSISGKKFLVDEDVAKKMRKPKSASHRENIRKAHIGEKNPMYGKVGVNKGKKFDEAWRQKLSEAKNPKRYNFINDDTNETLYNKSASDMIKEKKLSKTEVYKLVRGEKEKLRSGWKIYDNQQD